jgi:hypothetical protein
VIGKQPTLIIYLTADEVIEFQKAGFPTIGARIEVPWLATQVLQFWRAFP